MALANIEQRGIGERLTTAGDKNSDLFLVLSGKLDAVTEDGDKIAELGGGSPIGEVSFLDGEARTTHTICLTPVVAARFPAAELRKLMVKDKVVGFILMANLSRILTRRLRNANIRLDELLDHTGDVWKHAL